MKVMSGFVLMVIGLLQMPFALGDDWMSKDLSVVQRPLAEVQPDRPATSGLTVKAWVDHEDNRYRIGDNLVLKVRTNKDAYVSVLNVGTTGKVSQVFPNSFQQEQFVRAGTTVTIPPLGADYNFRVNGDTGTELIKVFASENETPLIPSSQLRNNGVFAVVDRDTETLAKDLSVEMKETHAGKVATYEKIVRVDR
jgi:hypothetical protein